MEADFAEFVAHSRVADEIIKASRDNKGENKGFANPVNEVTGGLNDALGGLFKF